MKILLLEDDLHRVKMFNDRVAELNEMYDVKSELVHVETAKDCITQLESAKEGVDDRFHLILLDHDLGGEVYVDINNDNTGSEVARWINKHPEKIHGAFIITHTFNPVGAKNITELIPDCIYIPAVWTKDKFHKIIRVK